MKKFAIALLVACTAASAAFAAQQDFTVVNNTGQAILTLHVSLSDSNQWGSDILGSDIIAVDDEVEVSFDNDEDQCLWDIRVTYEDGNTGDWRGVDLCETATVELS